MELKMRMSSETESSYNCAQVLDAFIYNKHRFTSAIAESEKIAQTLKYGRHKLHKLERRSNGK